MKAVQLLQHCMCSFGDVKQLRHSRLSALAYMNLPVQARVHILPDGLSVQLGLALSCRTWLFTASLMQQILDLRVMMRWESSWPGAAPEAHRAL